MFGGLWMRLCSFRGSLWRDTRGAVLIYVSVGSTVLLGGAALVIDAGRLYTMNSQLQAAAPTLLQPSSAAPPSAFSASSAFFGRSAFSDFSAVRLFGFFRRRHLVDRYPPREEG